VAAGCDAAALSGQAVLLKVSGSGKGDPEMAKTEISVIDFAVRQEKHGVSFYTKAAEKFRGTELAGLFVKLAREEAKHLQELIDIQASALRKGVDECFRAVEIDDYLEAVVREGILPKGEKEAERLEKIKTVEDACRIAMQAEKNAILLYTELAKLSKDKGQKKILEAMIRDEKAHMAKIAGMRADIDPIYAAERFGKLC
jgi:rubrerythrin